MTVYDTVKMTKGELKKHIANECIATEWSSWVYMTMPGIVVTTVKVNLSIKEVCACISHWRNGFSI